MSEPATDVLVELRDVEDAAAALPSLASLTPILGFRDSYLKLENLQPTGSFKIRGAFTKLNRLTSEARSRGVVAYSSGNHGLAVAHAARLLKIPATIVVPSDAPATKVLAIAAEGAQLVETAPSSDERRLVAETLAASSGKALIPPYDDREVIAGQGTVGLEILQQIDYLKSVVVPVGGGGLISGVAVAVKSQRPEVRVIGVEPELAADARESLREHRIIRWQQELVGRTIADGVRTQSVGQITFSHMERFVDEIVVVSEEEIYLALVTLLGAHLIVEPAGALSLAALLSGRIDSSGAAAVVSGGNASVELLESLVHRVRKSQEDGIQSPVQQVRID